MSLRAGSYIGLALVAAACLGVLVWHDRVFEPSQWLPFGMLISLAAGGQLARAKVARESSGRQTYAPDLAFFFAGTLLLEPALSALLIVIPLLLGWPMEWLAPGRLRRSWYLRPLG